MLPHIDGWEVCIITAYSPSIRIVRSRSRLRCKAKTGSRKVTVSDNGCGIPESEQNLIFERFFRGERKKQEIRGLGLGLPFSKLMAQAQKGDLVFHQSSEYGTSFALMLPLAASPMQEEFTT
ncbi:ATP-binding protein [Bacillus cereus]|nr:ATP-binding protein [Paenibacillus melissococcoides]MEB9895611.1 ATP-binding protein [Bacillus cereus]